jgi:hypothetical protein
MRKLLISLLLASAVATPALARPHNNDNDNDSRPVRAERSQPREESRGQVQVQRPQFSGQQHFDRGNGGNNFERANGGEPQQFRQRFQQNNDGDDHQRQVQAFRDERVRDKGAPDSVRDWRGPRRRMAEQDGQLQPNDQVMPDRRDRFDNNGALRRGDRPLPNVMRTRVPVVSDVPRMGTQPPLRVDNRRREQIRWTTDWRRDRRYDWRDWRRRHRSWFNLGVYYDPFGWNYQPYSIGWRLWPSYYGSNFWINDPWYYRLPYAPPGTRWVRYYDDAVLVDMWSGEVVDVIYNFFW